MKSFKRHVGLATALSLLLVMNSLSAQMAQIPLISRGSVWNYLDDGSDQGSNWRSLGFNDSTWRSGPAPLGYGNDGEGSGTTISYGAVATNKFVTTYFRKTFNLTTLEALMDLRITLIRDDGAVVYLNGTEVMRDNMPNGPISSLTLASNVVESDAVTSVAPTNALLLGSNVIAVEVHQVFPYSSDLEFDFALTASKTNVAPLVQIAALNDGPRLMVFWSDPYNESVLEVAEALGSATQWQTVTNGVVLSGTVKSFSVTNSTGNRFFRVRKL